MNKKIKIFMIVLIIFINIIFLNINNVQAAENVKNSGMFEVMTGASDFIKEGSDSDVKLDEDQLKSASDLIYNILTVIGMGIAVVMISIIGIKFMLGSAEEKAEMKETLIPFIIGAVVVFGAFGLWNIMAQIFLYF